MNEIFKDSRKLAEERTDRMIELFIEQGTLKPSEADAYKKLCMTNYDRGIKSMEKKV